MLSPYLSLVPHIGKLGVDLQLIATHDYPTCHDRLYLERSSGFLEIDVRRLPFTRPGFGRMSVEVEVANFYPALARPFKWFYTNTQSRIHVIVTHGFLKRLARMELEESAVGRFAEPAGGANGQGPQRPPGSEPEDVLVGSTPWAVVAALAAAAAVLLAAVAWILRGRD